MPLPPGLAGFVAAQEAARRGEASSLQQATGILGLQAMLEQQRQSALMHPLALAQMQGKIDEQNRLNGLLSQYAASRGVLSAPQHPTPASVATATSPDIPLPGGPTNNRAGLLVPQTPMGNGLQLPDSVQLELLHPALRDLGKVHAEQFKPTDKMRELVARGVQPGSPEWNTALGTTYSQSGAWQTTPGGGVQLAPGYAAGQGDIKAAEMGPQFRDITLGNRSYTMSNADITTLYGGDPVASLNIAQKYGIPWNRTQAGPVQPVAPVTAPSGPSSAPVAPPVAPRGLTPGPATLPLGPAPIVPQMPPAAQPGASGMGRIPAANVLGIGGGGPPVNMGPQEQADLKVTTEQRMADAKTYGELYQGMMKASLENPAKIAKMNRIVDLLKNYDGGKLAQTGMDLASIGVSAGFNLDPRLPNKQAAEALSKEVALELRSTGAGGGMPGSMSDADREFLRSMTPQLAQLAEGRRQIADTRIKLWQREMQVADMARRYKQKYNGVLNEDFFNQLQDWSSRNPIFGQ